MISQYTKHLTLNHHSPIIFLADDPGDYHAIGVYLGPVERKSVEAIQSLIQGTDLFVCSF
jgi:hypothetical protein